MSVEIWEPEKSSKLTLEVLHELLNRITSMGDFEDSALSSFLDEAFVRSNSYLMKLDAISWQVAGSLSYDELEILVRFFTLAEMQFTGWEGGKQSPVIFLVRILKERDQFPKELRKWIKTNTDNRYLPYGSAL